MYCLFSVVLFIVCVYMCTVLLSPGDNPIAVNKYIKSAAVHLLRFWFRFPPGKKSVCCECCVLSGRDLCDELITRPKESYRLWYVVVCDLETL